VVLEHLLAATGRAHARQRIDQNRSSR
jgi:hypothetical protein